MPAKALPSHKSQETGRSLQPLRDTQFDVVILGGGITGATILWDASLRGMKALLVEKNDFASGTTQATSKLIHGGLRYLKNGELSLVRESLRERRNLARIAPHAVHPEAFLMPVYQGSSNSRFILGAGLTIYDMLSFDRNSGVSEDHRLPGARYLDRDTCMAEEPGLRHGGLKGAYVYYDYANTNPERLCCEFIFSARNRGAYARNYTIAGQIQKLPGGNFTVGIEDRLTGEKARIQSKAVVNAGGPWVDIMESQALGKAPDQLIRSKGIHIITRKICGEKTVALTKSDKQHFFIIPWRGKSIVGTTDTVYDGHPDRFSVTQKDVEELIETVNSYFRAELTMDDVDYYYGGMRPLVDDGSGKSTYNASRKIEIHEHDASGMPGFFSVLGGKYTTSRALAESLLDRVCDRIPGSWKECSTAALQIDGGFDGSIADLETELFRSFPEVSRTKVRNLAARYGRTAQKILGIPSDGRSWKLDNQEVYYPEEIIYLTENEDIQSIADLYFRRSGLGTAGRPPETINRQIVDLAGSRLGWNAQEKKAALLEIEKRYVLK